MTVAPSRPASPPLGRFLSNGRYVSLLTARGTGFLADGDLAVTRWLEDPLADTGGVSWTVRDRESGAAFALGPALPDDPGGPLRAEAAPGLWTVQREHGGICARMTCWVTPDASAEARSIEITQLGPRPRTIDLTSYAEIVLQHMAVDAAHPVFSKLFVQTEWRAESEALFARRRPRGADESFPWLLHTLDGPGAVEFETDRARFLGRGRASSVPAALAPGAALSGTAGNVLDPVLALRRVVTLAPGESVTWHSLMATGAGPDELLALLAEFRCAGAFAVSREAAASAESARRRESGMDEAEAEAAQVFLTALARRDPGLRAPAQAASLAAVHATVCARGGAESRAIALGAEPDASASDELSAADASPGAWLIVADTRAPGASTAARRLARLARYARSLGLPVELMVLTPDGAAWESERAAGDGISTRDPAALGEARLCRLAAHARAWIAGPVPTRFTLDPAVGIGADSASVFAPERGASGEAAHGDPSGEEPLEDFNGFGGFAAAGREYVIRLRPDDSGHLALPPVPWTNVMANPGFGCLVSETGAGFTWSGNSREHRLTPWLNDPVLDPHAEALYVRDEVSGRVWSPQPGPVPAGTPYEVRHRPGSTTWTLEAHGLTHRTTVFVPADAPVRVAHVVIRNHGAATRRLRLVSYQQLVLGVAPGEPGVRTDCDAALTAVLAHSPLSADFAAAVAWAAAAAPAGATVCIGDDRRAFLGPAGRADRPAALASGAAPSVAARGDLDPAAIVEVTLDIPPGESRACAFLLGEESGRDAVATRLAALREPGAIERALEAATAAWDALAARLRITTPEPAIDRMVNHWLPYQNLSCRIWGRSAFYQSGGAFGFRDQLQDSSALVWLRPELTRAQILLHAAHQFVEGDVLHWWHPPKSRGIRTRFADDLLWLPWIAAGYVAATGDAAVLDESAPFLLAPALAANEDERFLEPLDSGERASVYEHAARAIDRSLGTGERGLPLFGCGDWNDGMNRVGQDGRGESVWMAFFLHAAISAFAPHAELRADAKRLARWRGHQRALEQALETSGWDGAWYRRGYYGDGAPIGSATSDECRIDALAQAWSVISRAVPRARAETAMRSAEQHLVSETDGLVRLLAPPFEHTPKDPGYIKGYVPGVRENGGQYTHAALWVVRAMADLGWRDRAARTLAMLSPVTHGADAASIATYQVEPYVIAADVYGAPPHVGRGGWTWYTGSAGWMYRVAVESVMGLNVEHGERLRLAPCLPDEWPEARIDWRVPGSETLIRIRYRNPTGCAETVRSATLDGAPIEVTNGAARTPLPRDGGTHDLEVVLGARE